MFVPCDVGGRLADARPTFLGDQDAETVTVESLKWRGALFCSLTGGYRHCHISYNSNSYVVETDL